MNYIEGANRDQRILLPESLDEYISGENPVRVIDAFVDTLDLKQMDFKHAVLKETGRPPYHPWRSSSPLHLRLSQPRKVKP